MDILTQLQDSIDSIARMFFIVVHHLNMQDPNKDVQQEHVQDICKKAKQIELLIDALPGINHSEAEQIEILKSLDEELKEANEEYKKAVQNADWNFLVHLHRNSHFLPQTCADKFKIPVVMISSVDNLLDMIIVAYWITTGAIAKKENR
ncbi:2018_t:CDS:2 [Scutellospora calospora]|uniref:2018_t:CDS:1 n=1 Tax=Scutellospora calospora TaxID=85575 RepID=A0ACA9L346_9GLOM|nr:2018_t:CDS:2 [Scutellospora calospora]